MDLKGNNDFEKISSSTKEVAMKKICKLFPFKVVGLLLTSVLTIFLIKPFVDAQNIIEEWQTVRIPPPPEIKPVTVDANSTALLLLDFVKQICNAERRPRCIASIPKVQKLLTEARAKGVFVVYSLGGGATPADIAKELAPQGGEPIVASGPDKFFGTDLEKILKEKNMKTVIITGTAAHGAVLYTASGAALRGMQVIVPVDGMSAEGLYPEQYTAWNLVNAPRISTQVILSRTDMIKF
jgi:nicotinamidase-related amidase